MFGEQAGDLAGFGVALGGFLAVDQGVADGHFKASAARGDQGQIGDGRGEFPQEFFRQTDGAGCVVSHHAIFDADRIFGLCHEVLLSQLSMGRD